MIIDAGRQSVRAGRAAARHSVKDPLHCSELSRRRRPASQVPPTADT